jgi:hypothetical protein
MSAIPLIVKGLLIHDRTQSVDLRVVFVQRFSGTVWLCRTDDNSWPFPMPIERLLDEFDPVHGSFSTVENASPTYPLILSDEETVADKRREKNYALIKPLITGDNELLILIKHTRTILIAERLKEVKSTRQTIKSLLLRLWKRGMTKTALYPDFRNCGGPGSVRNQKDKKIGAPRTITPGKGIVVNDEIRRMFRIAADLWLSKKKLSLQEALDHIIPIYFSRRIMDGNKVVGYHTEPDEKPTVRQLQHYIKTEYKRSHIKRKRCGQKNWDLNERAILGMADGDIQGPGDRFQIDATVADVYLVSQFDRRRIVGRPIIYFVVDVYSRLIVGLYVGFEGPSWIGAMMALVNMVTPKIEFCKHYDIDIDTNDWPAHHAPNSILADRGELMSVRLGKNITEELHIDIENTSPGRADLKSLVERRFGIVPAKYKQFTPGYVEQDFGDRGAKDYRLDAALNLYEFTQLVILAVIEHNFSPIRDFPVPTEMITEGFVASPLDLWHWGIVNRSGSLRILSIDEVALNVMPTDTAQVTEKGIKFHKGYYTCDTAMGEEWFSTARAKGQWSITVSYDPRDLGILYIRDRQLINGYERCQLLDHCADRQGKSLYELQEKDNAHKVNTASGENDRQEKRVFIDYKMQQIESNGKNATKAVLDPNTPKSHRTADIRNHRSDEKELQRGTETLYLGDSKEDHETLVSTTPPDISADDQPAPPLSKLSFLKQTSLERGGEDEPEDHEG